MSLYLINECYTFVYIISERDCRISNNTQCIVVYLIMRLSFLLSFSAARRRKKKRRRKRSLQVSDSAKSSGGLKWLHSLMIQKLPFRHFMVGGGGNVEDKSSIYTVGRLILSNNLYEHLLYPLPLQKSTESGDPSASNSVISSIQLRMLAYFRVGRSKKGYSSSDGMRCCRSDLPALCCFVVPNLLSTNSGYKTDYIISESSINKIILHVFWNRKRSYSLQLQFALFRLVESQMQIIRFYYFKLFRSVLVDTIKVSVVVLSSRISRWGGMSHHHIQIPMEFGR